MPVFLCFRPPVRMLFAVTMVVAAVAGPVSAAAFDLRSLWPFGRKAELDKIPDPTPYILSFEVGSDERRLTRELRQASVLYANRKTPPSGLAGLLARARQDVGNLTAVLYRNARYAGEVFITVDGRPLEAVGPFDSVSAEPVPVSVLIRPGAPFVFGTVSANPLPVGTTLESLGLRQGEKADSTKILAAETAIANAWRRQGHPLVTIGQRDVVANHRTRTLDVMLWIDPGPVADFGHVAVSGTERVNPDLVLRRAGIGGGRYTSDVTARAERRLRDLGVFDSVRVAPADHLAPDGTIPIEIEVSERPRRVIGATASYSSTEGAGVGVYWMHRNLWGGAEQLRLSAEVSRLLEGAFDDPDFRVAASFHKPAVFDPMTDFTLRTETYRETTDSYRVTAVEAEVGLEREFSDTLSGGLSLEIQRASGRDQASLTDTDYLLTTLTATVDYDNTDSRLDPTRGVRANLTVAPSHDFLQRETFATFKTGASTYIPLDEAQRFVVAGRVQVGVLTVNDINSVVPDRRFYAGGAGSVRGYAYQNIGPRDQNGDATGGRSLFELSGELRYRVSESLGLVAFVDAGNAYASVLPEFDGLKVGVGAGVRYMTPVGPIRFDLGVPLQPGPGDPKVAAYVGIGQAF